MNEDILHSRIVASNLPTTLDQSAISTAVTVRFILFLPSTPSFCPGEADADRSLHAAPNATISAPAPPPTQTMCPCPPSPSPRFPSDKDPGFPRSSLSTVLNTPAYPNALVALHLNAYARNNSSFASVNAASKSRLYRCDLIVCIRGFRSSSPALDSVSVSAFASWAVDDEGRTFGRRAD